MSVCRWLWWDLNLRPWAYESPALTSELQSLQLLQLDLYYSMMYKFLVKYLLFLIKNLIYLFNYL
jgi:hypothetical protein